MDFVCPADPRIHELFKHVYHNTEDMLAELSIGSQPVKVYLARPEDAILCKLAVGREKDFVGLRQLLPKLKDLKRLDWIYLYKLAKRFNLKKEIRFLEEKRSRDLQFGFR